MLLFIHPTIIVLTIFNLLLASVTIAGTLAVNASVPVPPPVAPPVEAPPAIPEPVATIKVWVLPNANHVESTLLTALQRRGIDDRNAIATVMGNVKQESRFTPNICEGGARVSYWGCNAGGYGLIQWTTSDRYRGLGSHAYRIGLDPSTAQAQISFMFTERQWKSLEPYLRKKGYSINHYMSKSYRWLGWGVHGNRTTYAYNYASQLVTRDVPVTELTDV